MSLRSVHEKVGGWLAAGRPVAVATVAATWGSSPCPLGSVLAVTAPEREGGFPAFAGSVSGGCIEAAVIDIALEIIAGAAPRLLTFGVSDETALGAGLACGGTIQVWVEALDGRADKRAWLAASAAGRPVTRLIVLEPGEGGQAEVASPRSSLDGDAPDEVGQAEVAPREDAPSVTAGVAATAVHEAEGSAIFGTLGDPRLDDALSSLDRSDARRRAADPACTIAGVRCLLLHDEPPERLILVGAGHVTQHLLPLARDLDFDVIVVDPRAAFLDGERFPEACSEHAWPTAELLRSIGLDAYAYVVALAHDPKIDDPAIEAALAANASYVGALGGRVSHAARLERLAEAGIAEELLARIHAPVGLPIGARTSAEIALAISAELVAVRRGAR